VLWQFHCVFMTSTGGTLTLEPVAVSVLLVLGTEDHCVDSHSVLLIYIHWMQTVMKRFKQLMKWNCDTWMMMGLFPVWVSKVIQPVRRRNTQSSILKRDILYYDVTIDCPCKILVHRVVLKRCFEACPLYKPLIVYICACMWRLLTNIMVKKWYLTIK
jgi:hypothetical protein